jgi:6-phosphogluconolactonase
VRPRLRVVDDPAQEVAERLAAADGHIVITGGSTPRVAYERAAAMREDWSGVTFWFSDERCVAPDHEHSNYRMAKESLLDRIQGARVVRMEGERGPADGAAHYERELREALGEGIPELGLMLIGLGPDAHTCSLFPNDPALDERERPVVGVETPGMAPLVSRVTLTLPVVNRARSVVFLVSGEDKAKAVRQAFTGPPSPEAPGSLVAPESGDYVAVLDAAAASLLEDQR